MSNYKNIMKRTLSEINPGKAYFAEMSKGMSSIEKKVLNNLIDEYDFGKVMYVFRNQRRAFDSAVKSGVVMMKSKKVKV